MTPQQEQMLNELYQFMQNLKVSTDIPMEVDAAFRERFGALSLSVSSKGVNTEDVTVISSVNFGAQTTGTTVVLDDPEGWLEISINGTMYRIPAYTS